MKIRISKVKRWKVAVSNNSIISIVDDDESVREAIESLIKSIGYRAEVFASAEDFLNRSTQHCSDCLILDVRMPGMNGLDLQRQLVANNCGIPVIFISAHGDEETRSLALKVGAIDFLLKPFSEEALLVAIQAALNSR